MEKTERRKNEDVAKALALENSDTGIVCFYIQDTSEIAKLPLTTQNKHNNETTKDNNTLCISFTKEMNI